MTADLSAPARSLVVSDCDQYRYLLSERWGDGNRCIAWVMLNPPLQEAGSSPTLERVTRYSRNWGFDRLVIVNLFARRLDGVEELSRADDVIGSKNPDFIRRAVSDADLAVVGWGDGVLHFGRRPRTLDTLEQLRRSKIVMLCFGLTEAGNPLHPSALAPGLIPFVWTPAASCAGRTA